MTTASKTIALEDILTVVQYGTSLKASPDDIGFPMLRMGNIQDGCVTMTNLKYVNLSPAELDRYRLVTGDILINRTNSAELVGKSGVFREEGEYVFASYLIRLRVDPLKADPAFVNYAINSGSGQAFLKSQIKEAVGQANINATQIRRMPLELPPMAEQQRLVAHIKALTGRLDKVRALHRQTAPQVESFLREIVFGDKKAKRTRMRELVSLRSTDVLVRPDEIYQFAGVYSFGRGVFKSVIKSGKNFAYPRLTRLKAGEFIYPKLMAWEGALGMVPTECDGCFVSPEFPVFEVDTDRVFPEVLDVYFRTPSVWPELAGKSVGTNVRRRRLNPQTFLDYEMPLPSRGTQMTLRKVWGKMRELKRLQTETEAELAAFTPALLAKAFRGEL